MIESPLDGCVLILDNLLSCCEVQVVNLLDRSTLALDFQPSVEPVHDYLRDSSLIATSPILLLFELECKQLFWPMIEKEQNNEKPEAAHDGLADGVPSLFVAAKEFLVSGHIRSPLSRFHYTTFSPKKTLL